MIFLFVLILVGCPVAAFAQAAPDVYYNTFEFADMRPTCNWNVNYWYCGSPVPLGPGEEPNQPSNVYTAFEHGGNDINSGPIFINNSSICHSGSRCLSYAKGPSTGGGTSLFYLADGGTLPNQTTDHLFYIAYQKFPSGYQFVFGKLNYMRDHDGTTVISKKGCPGVCTSTELLIEVGTPSANYACNVGPSCTITGDDQWHALEIELATGGGGANQATIRMWRDHVLVLEYCPACAQKATISTPFQVSGIGFGEYDNDTGEGGGFPSQSQTFYIDDIAVSRSRIGTFFEGSAPAAPAALTVTGALVNGASSR